MGNFWAVNFCKRYGDFSGCWVNTIYISVVNHKEKAMHMVSRHFLVCGEVCGEGKEMSEKLGRII
jgi:hypothetical protein